MTAGAFRRVLVPVEFESAKRAEIATDRAVEVEGQNWVVVAKHTVRALELASQLAAGGEVWLVHATPDFLDHAVYGGPEGTWIPAGSITELNETAREQSERVLQRVGSIHCKNVDLKVHIQPGRPLDVILAAAKAHPPDAIVLAASGRGRVRRAFLGSTADKVIRQSFCPVMVVPSGAE